MYYCTGCELLVISVSFAVVDSENNDSWTYFMNKLKEAIGKVADLIFVSNRHASIVQALEVVFPKAYHGTCYHHIFTNAIFKVIFKFKTDHCHKKMYLAAYASRRSEYIRHFENIRVINSAAAEYLEGIGVKRWVQ